MTAESESLVRAEGARPMLLPPTGMRETLDDVPPIACSLNADAYGERTEEWKASLAQTRSREAISNGIRLVFQSAEPLDEIVRLMVAEQECCPFFTFVLTIDRRGIGLEVSVPPDGHDLLESVFGSPDEAGSGS